MADFYLDYRGSDYNGGGYDSTITGATVNSKRSICCANGIWTECTAGSTRASVCIGFTSDMMETPLISTSVTSGVSITYQES